MRDNSGAASLIRILLFICCRTAVQAKYNRANGYEADCEVIYGDTDSVMVNFKVWLSCATVTARCMSLPELASCVCKES